MLAAEPGARGVVCLELPAERRRGEAETRLMTLKGVEAAEPAGVYDGALEA